VNIILEYKDSDTEQANKLFTFLLRILQYCNRCNEVRLAIRADDSVNVIDGSYYKHIDGKHINLKKRRLRESRDYRKRD